MIDMIDELLRGHRRSMRLQKIDELIQELPQPIYFK
jgi:hypothetical protein